MTILQNDNSDIEQTLSFFFDNDDVFEVCGIGTDKWPKKTFTGYYKLSDFGSLKDSLTKLLQVKNWYFTTNPVNPALQARSNKKFKEGINRTADSEIISLRNLLIDVDPVRPSGISSSNEEKAAAYNLVIDVKNFLISQGFPEPFIADSGNGYHLVYSLLNLETNKENVDLLKRFLNAIAKKFDTDKAKVDQKVFNPSRLVKLYGSIARKGDDIPGRPHRLSKILNMPHEKICVSLQQIEAIALPKTNQNQTTINTIVTRLTEIIGLMLKGI